MMRALAVAGLSLTLGVGSVYGDDDLIIISADALADIVAALERSHAAIETRYETTRSYGKLLEHRDAGEAWRIASRSEQHWRSHGHLLRVDVSEVRGQAGAPSGAGEEGIASSPTHHHASVEVWDGAGLWRRFPADREVRIDRGRRIAADDVALSIFNHSTGFWTMGGVDEIGSLSGALRRGRVIEQRLEGTTLIHRFGLVLRGTEVVFEVRVVGVGGEREGKTQAKARGEGAEASSRQGVEPQAPSRVGISGFSWEIPPWFPEVNETGYRARMEYRVEEWAEYDGLWLAARAHRDLSLHEDLSTETGRVLVGRREYVRHWARDLSGEAVDRAVFAPPMEEGDVVYDGRYGLGFRVGTTYLTLEGLVYETAEPIWEHPGGRLAEIMATATPRLPVEEDGPSSVRTLQATISVGFGLGAALLTLMGLTALRRIGGMRGGGGGSGKGVEPSRHRVTDGG